MNPLPLLLADLKRHWGGALAIVLLIAVAVALGVSVSATARALRQGSADAARSFDLLIGAPGSQTQLVLTGVYLQPAALPLIDGRLLADLAADPGVAAAAPIGFGDFHRGYPIVGTDAAFAQRWGAVPIAEGRMFARRDEVVLGAGIDWPLGTRFHPSHGQHHAVEDDDDEAAHQHQELTYTVVGRLAPQGTPWDRAILASIESVWWVHGLPDGHPLGTPETRLGPPWDRESLAGIPTIVVKPKGIADAYRLRDQYRRGGTMALFPAEVLIGLYQTLGDARALIAAIALGTQVLVVAAVLLAVLATLATRRKQLAVLRALGASRAFLFLLIWLEVEGLVLTSGLLGLGLGWAGAAALAGTFAARTGVVLLVEIGGPEVVLVAGLTLAGAALSLLPALGAYRTPVSTALRG
ncbi:membrane protein [Aliidongia dinghuensis]|uniref:Membrane protein n=1 Tax=Aliidongia dinghuensis TaxID=1867774 RepID=A0A8J3E4R1_9PROT|nr:FtsX-like permease family protein [Aliidongia dinghuensis]GGF29401.1 membrane protein [Aliidongia dinghuensis]